MVPKIYEEQILPCTGAQKLGTMLFIHGFSETYLSAVCAPYLAQFFDYYAINLPGHGDGENKIAHFDSNIKEYAQYVVDYVKEKNLRNLTLVGHSLGGGTVIVAEEGAREYLANLIVINPAARTLTQVPNIKKLLLPDTMEEYLKVAEYAYYDMEKLKNYPGFTDIAKHSLAHQLERREYLSELFDVLASSETISLIEQALKNIKTRTLYVFGRHDRIVPMENLESEVKRNPVIQTKVFENSGHCPHNEEAEGYIGSVVQFVMQQ
jgi:pimeloyl-ACP methyl ester carboxylesterase